MGALSETLGICFTLFGIVTILVSPGESPWSLTREREHEQEHECVNMGWGVNRRWYEWELECEQEVV